MVSRKEHWTADLNLKSGFLPYLVVKPLNVSIKLKDSMKDLHEDSD